MALSHLRPASIVSDTNSVRIEPALYFFTGIDYKPTTMIHRYNTLRETLCTFCIESANGELELLLIFQPLFYF